VADRVGRDRSYVTNFLRLLRLPEDLQELVQAGRLSTGHARTLLGLPDVAAQRRLARKIIERDWSVRATEQAVRDLSEPKGQRAKATKTQSTDPNVRAAESKLRRHFGTQVRIVQASGAVAGRIELEYYNQADLDRIYGLLTRSPS
jgi:ParB family transcriptional regulator, chromosome partitioning protein